MIWLAARSAIKLDLMASSLICLIWLFTSQLNNFQLCQDRSSWVEPVLSKDKCVLLKDTTQWRRWGSNPRPLCLESSTLPLTHCAPYFLYEKVLSIVDVLKYRTLVACIKALANSADPDQTASSEAVWSRSSLFAILTSILWISALGTYILWKSVQNFRKFTVAGH